MSSGSLVRRRSCSTCMVSGPATSCARLWRFSRVRCRLDVMSKLRVGLVGFGFVGPHHLDAIRRLGFADVTAIATSSAKTARQKAAQHGVEKSHGDWRDLVADPEIDVIDIATPTNLHAPVA